jgi:hypothetical protein
MREMEGHVRTAPVASLGTTSSSFGRPPTGFFCGVLLPVMDAGGVGLQISPDAGTTWHTVVNPLDGSSLVIATAGGSPLAIDITDKMVAFFGTDILFRFTCAAQSGARTLLVIFSS